MFQVSGRLANTGHGIIFYTESPSNHHQVIIFNHVVTLFITDTLVLLSQIPQPPPPKECDVIYGRFLRGHGFIKEAL